MKSPKETCAGFSEIVITIHKNQINMTQTPLAFGSYLFLINLIKLSLQKEGDFMNDTINILIRILTLHEAMKSSYFFTPPQNASSRRWYEDNHSLTSTFQYKGDIYTVEQKTSCSCRNVYYSIKYYKNDAPLNVDIRFIKKILKELESTS